MVRKSFRKWQKQHPNFMTPDVEKVSRKGSKIVELSSGSGFLRKGRMYGVTKIRETNKGFKTMGGKSFPTRKGATSYFNKLIGKKPKTRKKESLTMI